MSIGQVCNRDVVFVERDAPLPTAAALMREHHVGALVVVDDAIHRSPLAVLTDRDIVVAVVANHVDPEQLDVKDVVLDHLVVAHETDGVWDTIQHMRRHGVRRVPVVDKQEHLVGIVTLDDLLELLAGEMQDLVKVIRREQDKEAQLRT